MTSTPSVLPGCRPPGINTSPGHCYSHNKNDHPPTHLHTSTHSGHMYGRQVMRRGMLYFCQALYVRSLAFKTHNQHAPSQPWSVWQTGHKARHAVHQGSPLRAVEVLGRIPGCYQALAPCPEQGEAWLPYRSGVCGHRCHQRQHPACRSHEDNLREVQRSALAHACRHTWGIYPLSHIMHNIIFFLRQRCKISRICLI